MENEKRLIDANALLESIEGIEWYTIRVDGSATLGAPSEEVAWYKATDIYAATENAPTVDAVEVVRCKDCMYWGYVVGCGHYCRCNANQMADTVENDFCSYGERKDK